MGAVVEAIACGRPVEDLREGEQVSERMRAAACCVPALVPAALRALAPGDEERGTMVHCHTRFSEENQVQTYMHARIKFHAYSDI
jgi:hypothetical protein